jgi:L-amino acid N-acyltransferase YncA
MINIRRARESDFEAIWRIFQQVVRRGDTYTYDPETTREQAHSIWMADDVKTYVASIDEQVVGTYILKPSQPGLGSHVANAGYMVKAVEQGKGVGRAMCEHSLAEARGAGFLSMQFNMVVSTNEAAIALWKKMGFSIVGTNPKAFRHRELGLVDTYVMHRAL